MANSTQNFKLIKPLQEEFYNVDDFNKNADAVDAALAALDIKKAPSGFGLGTAAIDISGQDLNADRATGFYRGINIANAPSQGWWYVINMSHSDTGWYYQQAVSYGSGNSANIIFTRTKISGVWSAWKQFATIDGTIANADTVDGKHASAFAPSGFGLGIQKNLFENANLILNTGFYYCTGGLPSGVSDANVYHHAHSDTYAHQMAFEFGPNYSNIIYSRIKNNGTWLAWRQIATTDGNISTATKLATPRKINGVGFDGSTDITVTDVTKLPLSGGSMTGELTVPTIHTGNWYRSIGNTGWYNETYAGGWHMSDATWIRAYNDKNVYTKGVFQADGGFNGALHGTADNSNTVAGFAVSGSRNNVGNQIVRTDGNGYLQTGYINSSNGDEGNDSNPSRVWGTNGGDSYLRTYLTSALSVNYANIAGNANAVNGHVFNWSGQGGQPTWLWGGNDASNMYVYNPSNFNVNYANGAGNVNGYTADALARRLSGRNAPVITPLVNWATMAAKAGVSNAKNLNNAGSDISAYGGDYGILNNGDIYLTQSYRNFDAVLINSCNDSSDYSIWTKWESWELEAAFNQKYRFDLLKGGRFAYWSTWCYNKATANHTVSTPTYWACQEQNGGIIEIYGLNY